MRLRLELRFAGHVLSIRPRKSEADAKSTPPLLDQLAEDIEHIRDHGEHGKHPEAKHMADWVLAHINYLLLTNSYQRREDAPSEAGEAASNLSGVRTTQTVPLTTPLQGASEAGWRTSPDSIGYDDLEQYVECSECHTRTPHLDSAGERCTEVYFTGERISTAGPIGPEMMERCTGVMVQRPYDPIYGHGWPGEAPR